MAKNLYRKLTETTATKVKADHPAVPKSGDPCRVGTVVGIALINEEWGYDPTTGYRKQIGGISIDLPYNPATNSREPDGLVPLSFQLNEWTLPVTNPHATNKGDVGDPVYYQDAAADGNHCVVNKVGAAQAFVGTLREELAANSKGEVVVLLQSGGGPVDLT